jgi:hypothetical protein
VGEEEIQRVIYVAVAIHLYIKSWGWDLAEWSERCTSIPKITGSNPNGGSELTFRSDLLLTARGSRM